MAERRAISGYIRCSLYMSVFLSVSAASKDFDMQEELLARIKALEEQGRQQFMEMAAMHLRLEDQDKKLASQELMITDYKESVDVLQQTVAELQQAASDDSDDAIAEPVGVKQFETQTSHSEAMAGLMRNRRLLLREDGDLVAFHAVIQDKNGTQHVGVDQKIVFPDIMLNVGGGYHNRTGIFIAPRHGLYLFSATITSTYRDHVNMLCDIVVNGIDLVGMYAHKTSSIQAQASATTMTLLDAGDGVAIQMRADMSLIGGKLTSFTGCLVA